MAAYVPAVRSGDHVYTSGQLPMRAGELMATGTVGKDVTAEEAYACAQQCALNAIAAVKAEVGDLSRVTRVVKVVGFVASTPDFTGQPGVVNGASELLGKVFGDAGVHARGDARGLVRPGGDERRVEERLEVDEHRVLARGDYVLEVEVGGVQGVQQRHGRAEALVVAREARLVGAGRVRHVLAPPVRAAVEGGGGAQRRVLAERVEARDELGEAHVRA